jgi:DNA alkylation repair enzyme
VREPRILATLIDEPERVTRLQMDRRATSFDSWEICDQCCQNLFWRTRFALAKALAWTRRRQEFVKRAGLVLVAVLAVRDKRAEDDTFVGLLPRLIAAADDDRAYVPRARAGRCGRPANETITSARVYLLRSGRVSTATAGRPAGSPAMCPASCRVGCGRHARRSPRTMHCRHLFPIP